MTNGTSHPAGMGLFFIGPICAEYLIGYDDSTGDAVELLGGLIIFGLLYAAMALIIREVAVRLGLAGEASPAAPPPQVWCRAG